MNNKKIRIGCGQGFWGDWLEAPKKLAANGDLNYLILDYLAEVTMSVLAKQREKDSTLGYGRDFPKLVSNLSDYVVNKDLKIIANAGGLNPRACAEACIKILKENFPNQNLPKIAIVTGDNLENSLDQFLNAQTGLENSETHKPISEIKSSLKSINAYIGCNSIVEALKAGAQIVITGRVSDPSMCLGPLAYEFNWPLDNWDLMAAGTVAGHIIECGAQSSGGNYSYDWQNTPDLWNIGYPIIECAEDGSFIVTKAKNSGGVVSVQSVTEQLVYEIGDPKNYITPDVIADFTSINLMQLAQNEVFVSGIKGKPKPDKLKISATYHGGFMTEASLILVKPEARKKAALCKEIIEKRLNELNLQLDKIHFESLGAYSCIPGMEDKNKEYDPPEIVFRVAVSDKSRSKVERFSRELTPLVLSGPAGITGYASAKRDVKEVFSFWPSLIDRKLVTTSWELLS